AGVRGARLPRRFAASRRARVPRGARVADPANPRHQGARVRGRADRGVLQQRRPGVIRVAVVGAGPWGMNHVRAVASEPSMTLARVVDPDPAARERVTALIPAARVLDDADRVFSDSAVDAVIIATPAPSHAALACAAL